MKTRLFLAFLIVPMILGCNGGMAADANREAANRSLGIEPKYALRDCMVRVDFEWAPGTTLSKKEEVVQEVIAAMREAPVITHKLPIFFGHTTRDASYFVFYYADKCESRAVLTKRFIDEFVRPKSKGFPGYSIVAEGIEPGFDGVMPSGAWIPDQR